MYLLKGGASLMRHYFGTILIAASMLCLATGDAYTQGVNGSGTGGIHVIQGRIFLPSGRSLDSAVSVRLESTNFSTLSVYTDQNGAFVFRLLAPGNYTVVVDAGKAYEVATEFMTIDQGLSGSTPVAARQMVFNVPVYLRPKLNETLGNGVLDVKLSNVPKEARQHFDKGREL